MNSNIKVILISHLPLPYHKIGSWTNRYDRYIKNTTKVDVIICPKPELKEYDHVEYSYIKKHILYKIYAKLKTDRFYHYVNSISLFIKQYPRSVFLVHVVDNFGLLKSLIKYIQNHNLQNRLYLQYSYHGHELFANKAETQFVFKHIDELLFLTNSAINANLRKFSLLPKNVSISSNGIDTLLFNSDNRIKNFNKTIFLWCSQDRPKKGLCTILEIWDDFHAKFPQTELWIVGTYNTIEGEGITSFGRIENDKLPDVYKKVDVYLFPSLYIEGFGLTLAEALLCGCFCMASNSGGIPEVLKNGEYGWLVDDYENAKNWLNKMELYMTKQPKTPQIPKDLYSIETWALNMNKIIVEAKQHLQQKTLNH
jgi:glycosyltransferase involved in cell wall biosynthesis